PSVSVAELPTLIFAGPDTVSRVEADAGGATPTTTSAAASRLASTAVRERERGGATDRGKRAVMRITVTHDAPTEQHPAQRMCRARRAPRPAPRRAQHPSAGPPDGYDGAQPTKRVPSRSHLPTSRASPAGVTSGSPTPRASCAPRRARCPARRRSSVAP